MKQMTHSARLQETAPVRATKAKLEIKSLLRHGLIQWWVCQLSLWKASRPAAVSTEPKFGHLFQSSWSHFDSQKSTKIRIENYEMLASHHPSISHIFFHLLELYAQPFIYEFYMSEICKHTIYDCYMINKQLIQRDNIYIPSQIIFKFRLILLDASEIPWLSHIKLKLLLYFFEKLKN